MIQIRKYYWTLIPLMILAGCRGGSGSGSIPEAHAAAKKTYKGLVLDREFDYSEVFLESLVQSGVDSARLEGGRLVLDSGNIHLFPERPAIMHMTALFGELDDVHVKVILERINYSSISYSLLAGSGHDLAVVKEGAVHLRPDFYRANATEISTITGNRYEYDEYVQPDGDSCAIRIRLGLEAGDNRLSGRIFRTCSGLETGLLTPDPLTLREK